MAEVVLDRLEPADLMAARALSAALGWPHRVEDWGMMLALGHGVAARAQGALIGTALWFGWGPGRATLGMVLVAPELQGRGIGRRLMDAALAAADGRSVLLNATEEGRPLYERLGFAAVEPVVQFQGVCRAAAADAAEIRVAGVADAPVMARLDAAAFGAERGAAVAALLAAGTGRMLLRGGAPAGFAIRRAFGRGEAIGPLVAPDEAGAVALLGSLWTPGAFLRVDVPGAAPGVVAALEAAGLGTVDRVTALARGDWPGAARADGAGVRRFALVSQALG